MYKLVLAPNEEGYNPKLGNGLLTQPLLGGMPRQRKIFFGSVHSVPLAWSLDRDEMEMLFSFYFHYQDEPEVFLMDLIVDSVDVKEYQCKFVSELSWSKQGNHWQASIDCIVNPSIRNHELDQDIIDYWQSGLNPKISNLFDKLVNEAMPKALR